MLTLTDERAQSARAAPGVTPVDSSETGTPVRELIRPSVPGEPLVLVVNPQKLSPVEKRLEYVIQTTASVWEPNRYIVLCPVTWTFILSGWHPGTPVGCTAIVATSVRRSGL